MLFPCAHATHPQWHLAAELVLAQLRAQMALQGYARQATLGLIYLTDHFAEHAPALLQHLSEELPQVRDWAGTVGVGIVASGVEYLDEPALSVMLLELPEGQVQVFSGLAPLPAKLQAHTALVHADGHTPDLAELIGELAARTRSGYLFGGLPSSRGLPVQIARSSAQIASPGDAQGMGAGVFHGGLSGVAFGPGVPILSRVTQGCQPVGPEHTVTQADRNLLLRLDGEPALDVLLRELGVSLQQPQHALQQVQSTLAGLRADGAPTTQRTGHFGSDVTVRHIVGLDPMRGGVALGALLEPGMRLAFCQRNVQAARADLVRICAEIREEVEAHEHPRSLSSTAPASPDESLRAPRRIRGAVYISCTGRGGAHFGGPSAEMQIVRHALGDVPLAGFFAAGEIGHHRLYGYTGVLSVFTD